MSDVKICLLQIKKNLLLSQVFGSFSHDVTLSYYFEMKSISYIGFCLIMALCLFHSEAQAQSLEFTKMPSGPVNFDLDVDVAKINLHVKNVSSMPVKVWVTMDTSQMSPSHRSYFCWEQCYSFGVVDARNIAGGKPLTLKPGQDTNAFTAYVDHYAVFNEPKAGTSTLSFDFFNEEDPSDRISTTLVFNVGTTTSVHESTESKPMVSWNPLSRQFLITDSSLKIGLDLYSINGTLIKNAESASGLLPNGIYGYVIHLQSGETMRGIISVY